jgi:hypothetical protein
MNETPIDETGSGLVICVLLMIHRRFSGLA